MQGVSERRARPLQEGGFFRATAAAQDGVVVRVTTKAVNDGFVFALKFDGVRLGVAGEDAHGGYVWRHLRCASGSREN